MTRAMSVASILISLLPVYSGCTGGKETPGYVVGMSGDAHRGKDLIKNYGCGACHTIPGIYSARGMVGPPLLSFGRRTLIAGQLPNSPDNLVRWIREPQDVSPATAMPDLGLSNEQAHDIAAYLYTLR